MAQNSSRLWEVSLNSGERYKGVLIAISGDKVLMEMDGDIRGFDRNEIRWLREQPFFSPRPTSQKELPNERFEPRVRVNKVLENEIESALAFGSPFAIKVGYNKWYTKPMPWSLGVGMNVQAYRFTQIQITGMVRRYVPLNDFNDAFLEAGAGISLYQAVNGVNFREWQGWSFIPEEYSAEFFPVKQVTIGPGYRWETGMGIAFATKLQLQLNWYRLNERPNETTFIQGQYFIGTAGLSGSFIF